MDFQGVFNSLLEAVGGGLLGLLAALTILIVGYILARLLGALTRRLLHRLQVDNRIAKRFSDDFDLPEVSIENITGSIVFWIIILFAIGAALQRLDLTLIVNAINPLVTSITNDFLPALVAALVLTLVAWLLAVIFRAIVVRICTWAKLDERLTRHGALHEDEQVKISASLGTLTFWLVILLFIPAILDVLGIQAISVPFLEAIIAFFDYLPNIVSATVIFLVGWLLARVLRQLVTSIFTAIRLIDNLGERLGLTGEQTLSRLLGTITYAVIMILVVIAALDALAISAISAPAVAMLTIILEAIPSFIGAVLVLLIAYFIARLVSQLIVEILTGIGFDSWPARLGINYTGTRTPSQLVGYLLLIGILLLAAVGAADLLQSESISLILSAMVDLFFRVILALIIIGFGLYVANLVQEVVVSASGANGRFWGMAARIAILILVVAMALRQLGLASDIVNLAFGIILGAIAIAGAIAFGLGSREAAGREVDRLLVNWRTDAAATEAVTEDET